jgi:hypothetical protein
VSRRFSWASSSPQEHLDLACQEVVVVQGLRSASQYQRLEAEAEVTTERRASLEVPVVLSFSRTTPKSQAPAVAQSGLLDRLEPHLEASVSVAVAARLTSPTSDTLAVLVVRVVAVAVAVALEHLAAATEAQVESASSQSRSFNQPHASRPNNRQDCQDLFRPVGMA